MREFLESILGRYTPVTYTQTEVIATTNSDIPIVNEFEVVASGLAGVDWLYVFSGVAFLIVIYSIFRVLGGLICNKM